MTKLTIAEARIEELERENRLLRIAVGMEFPMAVFPDPKFNDVPSRGWYISLGKGLFYLHKDGLVHNGIQDSESGFWGSLEEAEAFLKEWKVKR